MYAIAIPVYTVAREQSYNVLFINPRHACAARVTVVVLCVCMCVCVCVHSYLPPHTLESQKRDTNRFCAIQGLF